MGFYLRKSVNVGPLRFNLSRSGIGMSTGTRGLRFGVGPRGNYVQMGRHGVYYRATVPPAGSVPAANRVVVPPEPSHEPLAAIDSGDVLGMRDSSSAELLDELSAKRRKMRMVPGAVCVAVVAFLLSLSGEPPAWLPLTVVLAGGAAIWLARIRDELVKSVVLFYEFGSEAERPYQAVHDAFNELSGCASAWHVEAAGAGHGQERHAGASALIQRKAVRLGPQVPPFVKTNLSIPCVPAGRQQLFFFPDRILVFEAAAIGAVSYGDLQIERGTTRFIEEGAVPSDTRTVDQTWKYVNKKGGPDKRFKDNRQIPVVLYTNIHFRSVSGLNELLQVSKPDVGRALELAIQALRTPAPATDSTAV